MLLNKIHVNSSTGLSLNERFTAIADRTNEIRRERKRSRSRSLVREFPPANSAALNANRRLLAQLERRHKLLAAMKLKRRSLRPINGGYLKRGTIKATRVAANGRPIKANSLTKVATMKADLVANGGRGGGVGRSLRRAGSTTNISQRLGINRTVGGAAERIAKRKLARLSAQILRNTSRLNAPDNRMLRQRSRSRQRLPNNNNNNNAISNRGRSRSRSRNRLQINSRNRAMGNSNVRIQNNGRSQSRNRAMTNTNVRRGRSMSRNRNNPSAQSIKDRLGKRLGDSNNNNRRRDNSVNRRRQARNVLRGRVDKRRDGNVTNGQRRGGTGGNVVQTRGRSRSRTREGLQQQGRQQMQKRQGNTGASNNQMRRRGRSRQRGTSNNNYNNNSNNNNNNRNGNVMKNGQQKQQQQRRGRSRSRRGGRTLAPNNKNSQPNKDDLDKELDQYMATTKSENNLDYLLKN